MPRRAPQEPSAEIPDSAKRSTIVFGILGLLFTVIGFVGAIPSIIAANQPESIEPPAATEDIPGAADFNGAIGFIFVGIGVAGLLLLAAWVVVWWLEKRRLATPPR